MTDSGIRAELERLMVEKNSKPRCRIGVVALELSESDRREFLELVMDKGCNPSLLAKVMEKRDLAVSKDIIKRHRRRECSCEFEG